VSYAREYKLQVGRVDALRTQVVYLALVSIVE
jgi:hypothetical protein